MAYIKQNSKTSCGVACIAMIADSTFEVVVKMYEEEYPRTSKHYTTTKDLIKFCKDLGFKTPQSRLKVSKQIPNNSICKVPSEKRHMWHWVVKRKGKIYDPSMGVFKENKYPKGISSYVNFN